MLDLPTLDPSLTGPDLISPIEEGCECGDLESLRAGSQAHEFIGHNIPQGIKNGLGNFRNTVRPLLCAALTQVFPEALRMPGRLENSRIISSDALEEHLHLGDGSSQLLLLLLLHCWRETLLKLLGDRPVESLLLRLSPSHLTQTLPG